MDRRVDIAFPLKKASYARLGGIVPIKIEIYSIIGCYKTIQNIHNLQYDYFVYGSGSNLLFLDHYEKTIALHLKMKEFKIIADILIVEAGMPLARLAKIMTELGYLHFAGLVDIPGEIGGSLYNNAGAFHDEIADSLIDVLCMLDDGELIIYKKEELDFSYRHSRFQKEDLGIILKARFLLEKGNKEEIIKVRNENKKYRLNHQPHAIRTFGSTFKNPKEGSAAYFIEKAGLKGYQKGKIKISNRHANFLEILGDITSEEVMNFIYFIQGIVYNKYTILLEIEIEIKDLKKHGRGTHHQR